MTMKYDRFYEFLSFAKSNASTIHIKKNTRVE